MKEKSSTNSKFLFIALFIAFNFMKIIKALQSCGIASYPVVYGSNWGSEVVFTAFDHYMNSAGLETIAMVGKLGDDTMR